MQYAGAYIGEGDERAFAAFREKLRKEGIIVPGNPDIYIRTFLSFGIEDARDLRERAQRKALGEGGRIFLIYTPSMTDNAQNALLKVLEEPPADARFFFIMPSLSRLLPTLRSRLHILDLPKEEVIAIDAFCAATLQKRLELLKPLYEHEEDERTIGPLLSFLQSLEKRLAREKRTQENTEAIRAVYRARAHLEDKGALLKVLAEHVALLTPKM